MGGSGGSGQVNARSSGPRSIGGAGAAGTGAPGSWCNGTRVGGHGLVGTVRMAHFGIDACGPYAEMDGTASGARIGIDGMPDRCHLSASSSSASARPEGVHAVCAPISSEYALRYGVAGGTGDSTGA